MDWTELLSFISFLAGLYLWWQSRLEIHALRGRLKRSEAYAQDLNFELREAYKLLETHAYYAGAKYLPYRPGRLLPLTAWVVGVSSTSYVGLREFRKQLTELQEKHSHQVPGLIGLREFVDAVIRQVDEDAPRIAG